MYGPGVGEPCQTAIHKHQRLHILDGKMIPLLCVGGSVSLPHSAFSVVQIPKIPGIVVLNTRHKK